MSLIWKDVSTKNRKFLSMKLVTLVWFFQLFRYNLSGELVLFLEGIFKIKRSEN